MKPTLKRSTDAQVQERVTEVQRYLLNGYTRQYVLEQAQMLWGTATRTTDEYIKKATEAIREINLVQRDDNLASITSNLWDLFRNSRDRNDFGEARQALMSIAKLRGLDIQVIEHFVNERPLKNVSDKELDEALGGGDGRH
jgi:hypothetical protein